MMPYQVVSVESFLFLLVGLVFWVWRVEWWDVRVWP